MSADHPGRPRPLPPHTVDSVAAAEEATAEAELLQRLEDALAALPAPERAAAVVAFGLAEGSSGVAAELDLHEQDAEALARSALQLLRGALSDVELDDRESFERLRRRRRRSGPAPES